LYLRLSLYQKTLKAAFFFILQAIMKVLILLFTLSAHVLPGLGQKPAYLVPEIGGEFVHIFDPNDNPERLSEAKDWYTNDHTFIKDKDGSWHAYGIIHHLPVAPWNEYRFFHIAAKSIKQAKWEDHGYAMKAKPGVEKVLWAPHIIKQKGSYWMFYNVGNLQPNAPTYASWGQLCLANSKDLFNWTRHDRNPLFSDPGHARDSYIMHYKNKYYYYYTKVFNEIDIRSSVAVRTGPDLIHWSGPKIAHVQPLKINWGGDAESPTVIHKGGVFYLFICRAVTEYNQTDVYWSKDPENFPIENLVCKLPVHAAEIIYDKKEGWFISNTGWDKKGLFLAPLIWRADK
jgi:hypothetical protein